MNTSLIKQLIESGKTDAEIVATPGLNDSPRKVPLWQLQEVLLASGAWVILDAVAKTETEGAPLAKIIMGLFTGKLDSFDAVKYQTLGYQALGLMKAAKADDAAIAQVGELIGLGNPNPTIEEIAAYRDELTWRSGQLAVERQLDAKYAAVLNAYNEAKSRLGSLNVGDPIPTADELWA